MVTGGQGNHRETGVVDPLLPGRVQLWWATPDSFTDDELTCHARALPPDERAAAMRFLFAEDRKQSLLTRIMVRHVLAQQPSGLPWHAWRFSRTAYGRPVIANPSFEWLSFNLSHTRTLVVCAVAAHARLGVDVESLARPFSASIADRYFTADEVDDVRRAHPDIRHRRLLGYWTLKEAFAKALGLGLNLPLDHSSFQLGAQEIRLALRGCGATAGEDPEAWRFFLGELAPAHVLAIAYSGAAPLDICLHTAEPLLCGTRGSRTARS
jgi:4'-phosphopantetheinyl transferase